MSNFCAAFLHLANFDLAWDRVAENQGCAGVDGETIPAFAQHKDRYLRQLRRQVDQGTYQPLPLRQRFIPKKGGGWRELGVPTVRDRIVQQALLQVLHPVMEAEFEPNSFAYRPGRSHRLAVEQVAHWGSRGYDWVLDADIVRFFERVQHPRLLAAVQERLDEPELIHLIQRWLVAGVLTPAGVVVPTGGIAQGSPLSPLLANVYLDDFDAGLAQAGHKLVRYADDFVVLARNRSRLMAGYTLVVALLKDLGLELHPDKTRLTTFDQGFRFLGHAFAGDVVVPLAPWPQLPRNEAAAHGPRLPLLTPTQATDQPTAMQQALVAALRQTQQPIPPPLYVVLGYRVRAAVKVAIESEEIIWRNGMSSLYVVEQGTYLQKEQGRFILKPPKDEPLEVPIQEVDRILLFGNVQLSTAVIATCLQQQIPVIFLSQLGEYKGHLWSAEITDLTAEAEQFACQQDESFGTAMARAVIYGKLWNSKILLQRQNRKNALPAVQTAIEAITQILDLLTNPETDLTLEQLRGHEGNGAKIYFQTFPHLIKNPGFSWQGRNFHPPTDPFNSLLSFGYTLLFNNVFSLLLAEGLNPYLGHLHGAERQKAYLAFDLMEEFRSPLVDTLVLKLVNKKILRPTDFTWPKEDNGVYLTDPARRIFLRHFEQRITEAISHPDVKEPVTYRRAIHLQVQRYKRTLLSDHPYEAFRRLK